MQAASRQEAGAKPGDALLAIASALRDDETLISGCVVESGERPALGLLVASGPRAAASPGVYAQVIESVREGYLLHYGEPRLIATADRDLELLAGDYMYAEGLALLASLGDVQAVRELAELISLCAQAHVDGPAAAPALWLASAVAIGAGSSPEHESAKRAFRGGEDAAAELWLAASSVATDAGLGEQLRVAAEAVGFQPDEPR
jgi:hypothetical protein